MLTKPDNSKSQRAADMAYNVLEEMIVKLELKPGTPVIEAELMQNTGLGRTPLREALMRMSSHGLILQMPRRGLNISNIEMVEHISMLETRRAIEKIIAQRAALRANAQQKQQLLEFAQAMQNAAQEGDIHAFMQADKAFDLNLHAASRNPSAVAAVTPLVIKCRRFWYVYQHEGDLLQCADYHMQLAQAIERGSSEHAVQAINALMNYQEAVAKKIMM